MSIAALLMVVHYSGMGVVTKVKHRHRKAIFPKIVIHFEAICVFAWTCGYAASRSIFPCQDGFWRPFSAHVCNHVEYTEELESVETSLEGVPQYPVFCVQARRAREGAVLGDAYLSVALYFLIYLELFCYPKQDDSRIFDVTNWVNFEGKYLSVFHLFV